MKKTLAYIIASTGLLAGGVGGISLGLAINDKPVAACEKAFDLYEETTSQLAESGTLMAKALSDSLSASTLSLRKDYAGSTQKLKGVEEKSAEATKIIDSLTQGRKALEDQVAACLG